MMWAGIGSLGLAAVRWFWHAAGPLLSLEAQPGGVRPMTRQSVTYRFPPAAAQT